MKKIFFLLLFISFIAVLTFPVLADSEYPLKVIDGYGSQITIAKLPERIISLAPNITEILFSLGLDDKIAAVTNNCDYPAEAFKKQKIGDIHINTEKIISLKPDLIISEGSVLLETSKKLGKLGIPILIVRSDTIDNFKNSFLTIGKACGKEKEAVKLIKSMENQMASLEKKLKKIKQKKPKVYLEIWNMPLQTTGDGTFINEIIQKAGGENIFKDAKCKYPIVNMEEIITRDPEVIILTTSKIKDIYSKENWKKISAVKNKRVYEINPDIISRPTLRLEDALKFLSKKFYPAVK